MSLSDAALVDIGTQRRAAAAGKRPRRGSPSRGEPPVDQLIGSIGNHAGAMQVLGLLAARLLRFSADPGFQVLDESQPTQSLIEMQCHGANCWRTSFGEQVLVGG